MTHLWAAMNSQSKPGAAKAERERRLAEQLRVNLRRRKAQARANAARNVDAGTAPDSDGS